MKPLPVLYVSHGSPMTALEDGVAIDALRNMGTQVKKMASTQNIAAIVMVSAHWLSHHEILVGNGMKHETIYDFYGFPESLYQLNYPAKGSVLVAQQVQSVLSHAGFNVQMDERRGLDHGAWIPLRFMFPDADIPVVPVSIPMGLDNNVLMAMGQAWQKLRESGVLFVFSGSVTHNLQDVRRGVEPQYVQRFGDWLLLQLQNQDIDAIKDYRQNDDAKLAHPSEEHFLPILMAMAASRHDDQLQHYAGGVSYDALLMDHYMWHQ